MLISSPLRNKSLINQSISLSLCLSLGQMNTEEDGRNGDVDSCIRV